MKSLLKSATISLALASVLAGCAVGASYQRPDAAMPEKWDTTATTIRNDQGSAQTFAAEWWKQFGSAELNQLMEQSLAANHDLAAAASRIRQARASLGITSSTQWPSAELSVSGGKNRNNQSAIRTTESSQAGITVAYEADLWGGIAAGRKAAEARVDSSMYDRDAVALVLQSDVASNYFQALALKDRLAIARKNLEAARNVLSLVELRYEKGATTGLEVSQQRTSVLNIEAQIPQLEQNLRTVQTALAVLLGRPPQGFSVQGSTLAGMQIPAVAAYQPASLLERRPDIKRAEAQLVAANADVNAARTALYPSLRISASSIAGGVFTSGSSLATSLAASLAQTLFDGGRLRGQVSLSQAQQEELVQQYQQGILTSLKEVQDSLGAVASAESRQQLLTDAAREAQEAFRIANVRFQSGSQDMLTLLDSQRTQLSAEDARVQADLARFTATIDLYKALGGGWSSARG
ncbi:efflux transporter outer membrane subunit [Oxalobacteraceae bacterium R-40]|uniref:Efflux transporter outer membrane subunit n=1 Tax=Keguizhuia sedimenti TaxID=3064264 RepID=A0ABU1BKV5_9BURK|nr:efflux transporter outer membrane subunit [Oxalobacteraceae bacterium R-40]